jgi:hypothetical protein
LFSVLRRREEEGGAGQRAQSPRDVACK